MRLLVALALVGSVEPALAEEPRAPLCAGEYADELSQLAPRARELERDKANQYSYCLRTQAVYECLSYGPDGAVRRSRRTAIAHGTAFAYRKSGAETYLLTNDHVASWPQVTDEEHKVEEVPVGCKLVAETLKIVDDEDDGYEANDIVLQRAAADSALDVAILKTHAPLKIVPWRIGRSSALRAGNVVAVRGFPLGAFAALNLGKVVNGYDHDTAHDWDHVDFVVDALLSPGNSGSPVLAVSCRTGEYELVGVYHAGYVAGNALNVVVGIDQLRDFMATLKRTPRTDGSEPLGVRDREALHAALVEGAQPGRGPGARFFFPLGPLVASARAEAGGAIWFEVYTRGFPLHEERLLIVEDLPRPSGFGALGRLYLGNRRGLRGWTASGLDPDARAQLERVAARLRAGATQALAFRKIDPATAQGARRMRAIERARERQAAVERDAAQSLADLADRLGPRPNERALRYAETLPPPPAPPVTATRKPR